MKNTTKKLLALLLAGMMLLPLAACGETTEDPSKDTVGVNGTTAESEAGETELPPAIAKKDYKDTEFIALYCADTFRPGYYFVEEDERTPGNDLEDKIFERTLAVEEYLGVDVIAENGGNYLEYGPKLTTSITAGDDTYQLVLTHPYLGVAGFITGNHIRSFNDFESLALDREYWNLSLMEELAINGEMYVGYNDFCLAQCYVIGFNKTMVKEYANTVGNLYEQVENRQWTMERFIEYTSLVSKDNGDGNWDEQDTYGFAGMAWVPLISFQHACDIPIVRTDADGELYISPMADNGERIVALDQMLFDFVASNSTYTWVPAGFSGTTTELHLDSNRVMFETMNNFNLITTKESEVKVGVLPYPKWDEKQENYKTLSWNGVMGIPTSVKDLTMAGDVIEMLAYYSDPVTTAFYETLLGAKVADAPEDVQMLDIIWSSQTSDIGLTFSGVSDKMDSILYAIPHHTTAGRPAYATYVSNKQIRSVEKDLARLYSKEAE